MGHNYSQRNRRGPVGGQRGPQPSQESERAHGDEVCAEDNLSEVSIPSRANIMKLGGKKMCSLFSGPTDTGYDQSVYCDVGRDSEWDAE